MNEILIKRENKSRHKDSCQITTLYTVKTNAIIID